MQSLENEFSENIQVIHKSITVLLLKGLIGFLIVSAIYLIGAIFISVANSATQGAVPVAQSLINFWPSISVSLVVLFLYALLILFITLDWITSYYILDGKSVITHSGIILSKEGSYDMAGIESVEISQGLFGKIFNFGTLTLFNPILKRDLKLKYVPDPYVKGRLIQHMHPKSNLLNLIPNSQIKDS
jgi:uncharacterized membrane protein YdbT with pleckstrin-like domain